MAFALVVLWLRYVALPHIDEYRPRIFSSIEKASGMAVSARRIDGGWEGLRPHLSLQGFELADKQGRVAVAVARAEVTLSWWSLLRGRVRFHDVDLLRPMLELRRGLDGRLYLADQPLDRGGEGGDDALAQWLLAQPRLGIHDAVLAWRDDLTAAPEVRLTDVQITLRRHLGEHYAALSARPPPELGSHIDLRADVRVRLEGGHYTATGRFYGETRDTDLAQLRTHMPLPDTLRSGVGNLRLWADLGADGISELVTDLTMRDARAQLDTDAQPLDLETVSGRAVYRGEADGYSVATHGLRFRVPGVAESFTGNFSLARRAPKGQPPHVEVGADGIDLKLAATLLEYLPVPRDLRSQIVRFAPRGRLDDATFSWTGEDAAHAKAYALRGRFSGFGVNAVDAWPGASGLSGHIEGTQAGGTLEIDSRAAGLELPAVFREPLAFDTLAARAEWKGSGTGLAVDIKSLRFANADGTGEASGAWHALSHGKERSPGQVDLKGRLEHVRANRLAAYLPNAITPARNWVDRAVVGGEVPSLRFELRGDMAFFPWGAGHDGHFGIEAEMKDGQLKYLADWPGIDGIDGMLRFDNRHLEIRAPRAAIFASRASDVSVIVDDVAAHPARVRVEADIDTTGADSTRFLRESPLVNGPGAFTRAVTIEGPARLKLALDIPLGPGGDPMRVAGDVQLSGDITRAGSSLVMRDVRGHILFSERGVRGQDIAGTLFEQPARLAIATQPDGAVVTTLEGRIDAPTMATYAPAFVAPRIEGSVAWRARMHSNSQGNELTIQSDLVGLAVALPTPLAKGADTARPVTLTIANLGTEREATRVALEGGVYGRFARNGARWNAAVGFGAPLPEAPLREGLWLYGALPVIDSDAWRAIFAPAPGAVPGAASEAAMELNGFDLRAGTLRFLGRDFPSMHAALERKQGTWAGHVESPTVAGDIEWDPAGRGRVAGRLERLALNDPAPDAAGTQGASSTTDLPAIALNAKRFDFRGHWLGELMLDAKPSGDEWRIDRLDIVNEHAQFHSSGGWRRTGPGSLTSLAVKLDTSDLNALLKQFGYGDYVRRGTAALSGELAWSGLPQQFALAGLAGTMHVEAHRGQFAKIPTGAGKLLGLLSLQSLPRRAMFDFRDVFGEGFAFERIQGDVKVARGVLLADEFEISGPAAFVTLSGEVSLPQETQVLTLRVIPEVSEGIALAATVFGTPVLGLSTLVLSKLLKNPLGKAVAYEYRVTGSWDNPVAERISAPARTPAASASAEAPANAATNPE